MVTPRWLLARLRPTMDDAFPAPPPDLFPPHASLTHLPPPDGSNHAASENDALQRLDAAMASSHESTIRSHHHHHWGEGSVDSQTPLAKQRKSLAAKKASGKMDTMGTNVNLPAYSEYTRFGTNYRSPSSIGGGGSEPASTLSRPCQKNGWYVKRGQVPRRKRAPSDEPPREDLAVKVVFDGQSKLGCWCSYGWVFLLLILVIVSLVVSNLSVYFLMRDGCSSQIHRMREGQALEGRGTEVWSHYQPPTPAGPIYPGQAGSGRSGPNRRTPAEAPVATYDPFRGLREEISRLRAGVGLLRPPQPSGGRILPPDPSEGPGVAGIIEIGAEVEAQTATNPSINEQFDIANWVDWSDERIVISRADPNRRSNNGLRSRARTPVSSNAAVPVESGGSLIIPVLAGPSHRTDAPDGWPFNGKPSNEIAIPGEGGAKPTYIKTFSHIYEEIPEPTSAKVFKRDTTPTEYIPARALVGENPNIGGHTAIVSSNGHHFAALEAEEPGVRISIQGKSSGHVARADPDDPLSRIDIGRPLPTLPAPQGNEDPTEEEAAMFDSGAPKESAVKTGPGPRRKRRIQRLPRHLTPILYKLQFTPQEDYRTFHAKILIEFACNVSTKSIQLHGEGLRISASSILLLPSTNLSDSIPVRDLRYDADTQILSFNLFSELRVGEVYVLGMKYSGDIGEEADTGLWGSSYVSPGSPHPRASCTARLRHPRPPSPPS